MTNGPPHAVPATTRSRLALEVASELVGWEAWPYKQARLSLRKQGSDAWSVGLFGSDTPAAIDEVARGEVDVAMINPAGPLTLAHRGTGPYQKPLPVRVITIIPSLDWLGFGVTERTGLTSLEDIRDQRFPLRLSMRGQPDHSIHLMLNLVLSQLGFSLEDIVAWGGEVRYDPWPPNVAGVARGEVDAIFDEAITVWGNPGLELGMRFLPVPHPALLRLEALGLRKSAIPKADYPRLAEDVMTVDYSGWPVFTHADASDELIHSFCAALEARKDRIPWQGEGPLPLDRMCRGTPDCPLDVPFHPAAERFWRERGYLNAG